jgi:FkbM family methyltransferase
LALWRSDDLATFFMTTVIALLALAWTIALTVLIQRRHAAAKRRWGRLTRQAAQTDNARRRAAAREAEARLAELGRSPRFPVRFCSRHGEDLLLWELFRGRGGGFFVEAGAFDGYTHSNTYALEAAGWEGLLVEPIPERAEAARKRRPGSRVVNAALAGRDAGPTIALTRFEGGSVADELGSHAAGLGGRRMFGRLRGSRAQTIDVPTARLDELLADRDPERAPIDVVILDVEGAEMAVLDGFDLDRFRPHVLLIEDQQGRWGRRAGPSLPDRLAPHGYAQAGWVGSNRLFVREDEPELLRDAVELAGVPDEH